MPNPGQELSSIDFASMLGGPLDQRCQRMAVASPTIKDLAGDLR